MPNAHSPRGAGFAVLSIRNRLFRFFSSIGSKNIHSMPAVRRPVTGMVNTGRFRAGCAPFAVPWRNRDVASEYGACLNRNCTSI